MTSTFNMSSASNDRLVPTKAIKLAVAGRETDVRRPTSTVLEVLDKIGPASWRLATTVEWRLPLRAFSHSLALCWPSIPSSSALRLTGSGHRRFAGSGPADERCDHAGRCGARTFIILESLDRLIAANMQPATKRANDARQAV
jgi:hypothetical protein